MIPSLPVWVVRTIHALPGSPARSCRGLNLLVWQGRQARSHFLRVGTREALSLRETRTDRRKPDRSDGLWARETDPLARSQRTKSSCRPSAWTAVKIPCRCPAILAGIEHVFFFLVKALSRKVVRRGTVFPLRNDGQQPSLPLLLSWDEGTRETWPNNL